MSEQKRLWHCPHAFPFQLCKVQLHPGDAAGTTIQRERSKQVWINQILSKNWAKSHSTTEDGEVVIIYTGIAKKGESGNLMLSKGIIRQASSSAVAGRKGQKKYSQISRQKIHFSPKPFSMSSGANALPASAEGAYLGAPQERGGGHDMCHRTIFAAKEHLLLNQCKTTASNAHTTTKHQQKPNGRWTETCSRIQSHLSLFTHFCCFTNWPTVPNPRFSKIALAEGITRKNNQCQLTNVTEEFFPGGWGNDDRSWKTKIPERGKCGPLGYIGMKQQEQHSTLQVMFSSAKAGEKFNKDHSCFPVQTVHFSGQRTTLSLLSRLASE